MNTSPIALAVSPRRAAAVARAVAFAKEYVSRVESRLAESGWDMKVAFPFPNSTMSRRDYVAAKAIHDTVRTLVKSEKNVRMNNKPHIVAMSTEAVARFLEVAAADAGDQFDAYVYKLEGKVGEVTEAAINAAPLWDGSVLTVKTAEGETQQWKTKMIINVSCLGKVFNQWPTRRAA